MISKTELKYLSKLSQKKYRILEKKFLVEGKRFVEEGLKSRFVCSKIFVTEHFKDNSIDTINLINSKKIEYDIINKIEIEKLTFTENPQGIIAVFEIPDKKKIEIDGKIICLDNISDPGNVGTILRTCVWFGIKNVFISENSVELFNPKVLRASMGAIFSLNIFDEVDLVEIIKKYKKLNYKSYIADLNGVDFKKIKFDGKSIIIFSNEAFGPTKELLNICDTKITIPKKGNIDSLNVSVAAAVILSSI
ncbi:MAG: RNA methyltransferase [Ignavibacteriae bacterium]|nr:RNA methyltransferase [Ignavibacteriota bacterium]